VVVAFSFLEMIYELVRVCGRGHVGGDKEENIIYIKWE
jgi:hypothetical protein